MSESMKPRFAVDLNEIERQLAQAQSVPVQPAPNGRADPLAELARIVGQDDPFQTLLANEQPARPRAAPQIGDLFAVRPEPAAPRHAPQPQAAPAYYAPPSYAEPQARHQDDYAHQAPTAGYDDGYDQEYYEDPNAHHGGGGYGEADDDYAPRAKPRARKGVIAVGAVLGVAVLGAGAAFFLGGTSSAVTGDPPLIKATNEPIKVQPQNPGGVEIPNQNKEIYERADQDAATKVVTRTEQPIDVEQAVRMNAEATGATANPPASNGLNLGEPRKVRTVTIRPDGTVIRPDGTTVPPASQAAAAPPAMTMPAAVEASQPAQPSQVAAAPATPAPKAVPVSDPSPQPKAEPVPQPQRIASAQAPAPAPVQAAPKGGFAVQLGLANSESGAQKALERYQQKYPELAGLPGLIRKAEVNGNTIFRVRVGPMERNDASTLCSKLQGQGGQCFVAKN